MTFHCFTTHWAIPENIHTPLMDDNELGTQKFQDFQERQQQFMHEFKPCRFKFLGNSRFYKILNGFPGIPVKTDKILEKFMEFQSGSPSIYCRISNVIHGGCMDIFWNSPF